LASKTDKPPLVIFGLDAGDPDFISKWAKEGFLPTIASLFENGSWGKVTGPELICEHGIWVSLFSGISRSKHGYYYYQQLKPGTYDLQPMYGEKLRIPPFWSYLNQYSNKNIFIMDVPDGYIIDRLSGIQIMNWATHDMQLPFLTEPNGLREYIHDNFGSRMKIDEKLNSHLTTDLRIYRQLLERIQKRGSLCRGLLKTKEFDLIVIAFSESHTATHQFWQYKSDMDKLETKAERSHGLANGIRNIYQAIDREMGLIISELPENANVVVVSSTGMQGQYPSIGLTEDFCHKLGYQVRKEIGLSTSAGPTKPINLIRKIIPQSYRTMLSGLLPQKTQEFLLADKFRTATDWEKTAAFSIPSVYTSFVRINLRGREPKGIIGPGQEYEDVIQRLESDFIKLVDPQTGQPAVQEVKRTDKLFGGGPSLLLPDLFVNWKPCAHFIDKLMHPKTTLVQKKPEFFRGSDHTGTGLIISAGPDIQKRGFVGNLSLLDLVPTFLSLLGQPQSKELHGKVVQEIINP